MYTQDRFATLVYNHLAEACFAFVLRHKTTRIGHWQLVHLIRNEWFVGGHGWRKIALFDLVEVFLCKTNTSDFRVGINDARDSVVSDALEWQLLEHTTDRYFSLTACHMCEHDLACDITSGIDILEVGMHEIVYNDATTIHLEVIERL